MNKFILNADDFGKTQDFNRAVLTGYNDGFIRSASLMANCPAFDAAVNEIIPECQHLSVGVHLNLIEGKSLTRCKYITDKDGNFDKSYLYFILNAGKKEVLEEIEREFRAQIEKIQAVTSVDHIDSHCHTHAIPPIFRLVCKLATEYKIPYVRTQYEEFYIVPELAYVFNIKFMINILKVILLNTYTSQNRKTLKNYNLKTNDFLIGVGYTGMMDSKTLEAGLRTVSDEDGKIVEALIHPCSYLRTQNDSHYTEFKLAQDKILENKIFKMGFEISNHKV